jgi:hypothetical protein
VIVTLDVHDEVVAEVDVELALRGVARTAGRNGNEVRRGCRTEEGARDGMIPREWCGPSTVGTESDVARRRGGRHDGTGA